MLKLRIVAVVVLFILLSLVVACNAIDEDFEREYKIETKITGTGHIRLEPKQESYDLGTKVKITAVGEMGNQFSFWKGDLQGSSNPEYIEVTDDLLIEATFAESNLPLDPKNILTASTNTSCETKVQSWLSVEEVGEWSQIISWDLSSVNQISNQAVIKSIKVNTNNLEGKYLHLNIYVFNEAGEGYQVNSLNQLREQFQGEKVKQKWSVGFNVETLYSSKVIFLPSLYFKFE